MGAVGLAMNEAATLTDKFGRTPECLAIVDMARKLAPLVRELAPESERLRTLAPELVDAFVESRLFGITVPHVLGGLEVDAITLFEVIEILSAADGSAGWVMAVSAGSGGATLALFDPEVAREMVGEDVNVSLSAASGVAIGRAVPIGDGKYKVSGRWPFLSGCVHSKWLGGSVILLDEEGNRRIHPEHGPEMRTCYFRNAPDLIIDNWDPMGMRGTGSHDVEISDLVIPESHMVNPFRAPSRLEGALWRIPWFSIQVICLAAVPLGIARGVIDRFIELAPAKRRSTVGGMGPALSEDPWVQAELAKAEASVQAARAYVLDAIAGMWQTATLGDAITLDQRVRLRLAARHAMEASVQAIDGLFQLAGARATFSADPLQRAMRDIHTLTQHITYSVDVWAKHSRHVFGIEQPTLDI